MQLLYFTTIVHIKLLWYNYFYKIYISYEEDPVLELSNSKLFRENIRLLERKLGLLKKNTGCCYDDITFTQCHALVEIGRTREIMLKDLASILAIDISTTSRTVDGLVNKHYVKRLPSLKDRRSVEISLTETGIEMFRSIETTMDEYYEDVFSHVPDNEKANILHSLDVILSAFHETESKKNL